MKFKLTFWKVVFVTLMVGALYSTALRFGKGLGASTNLNDQFPWGLWIGFDVLCGVMLAAGGFTLTAAVHLLRIRRLEAIVRPTVLTAFLGYLLVCVALLFDLGRPYRIWHPLIMRNPHSVMFEVAYCVMLYTLVLALEFAPIVFERFDLHKPLRVLRTALIPLVIVGVILSTLHQSSLGTLYLIMPNKLHPLWYSPLLPVQFFISAIAVGLAMTIFESSLSARYFGRQLELPILRELGRVLLVVLAIVGILRLEDLLHRGVLQGLLTGAYARYESSLFVVEIALSLLMPLALLSLRRVRQSAQGLYWTAVLVVLGFVTNRLNVSITGMESAAGRHYIPRWTELVVTGAIIATGFALFGLAAKYLPIFPPQETGEAAGVPTGDVAETVLTHAGD